jgi:tripartite-type tricarboxylate transporter receptor subunit TctC
MSCICRSVIAACLLFTPQAAFAQSYPSYPSKPVRLIVPVPPGGPIDTSGRLLAQDLQGRWGQSVIVENKAGGPIGPEFVAKSAPDGYTLMIISSTPLVSLPHLQKVPYDVLNAFVGVIQTVALTYVFVAHPTSGISSLAQLIDEARKTPGRLNFATGGVGAGQHLYLELFKRAAEIELTHIPYKGAGPALQGFIGGEVHGMVDVSSAVIPLVRAGKARALMVTGGKPFAQLPEAVSFDTLYPGAGITNWHGIFAPAGVSRAILDKIAEDVRLSLQAPAVLARFRELGMEPTGVSGDAFSAIVRNDHERWGDVIRKNKITAN